MKKESHAQFMFCCFRSNQYDHCQEMSPTKRAGWKGCMKDSLSCIFGYILDMVLLWGFISFWANYCIHFNLRVTLTMESKIRKIKKRCQGWGCSVLAFSLTMTFLSPVIALFHVCFLRVVSKLWSGQVKAGLSCHSSCTAHWCKRV